MNTALLLKLFPIDLSIPHHYRGWLDGVPSNVKWMGVKKGKDPAEIVVKVQYEKGVLIVATYHAGTAGVDSLTVNGATTTADQVHFHDGFDLLHGGPWMGFSFSWTETGSLGAQNSHRADIRAYLG